MHVIMIDVIIWGRLTLPRGPFRAQGSALTRNVARSHGSKNLLQRGILYSMILLRHGRLNIARKFGNMERRNFSPGRDRLEAELKHFSGRLWRLITKRRLSARLHVLESIDARAHSAYFFLSAKPHIRQYVLTLSEFVAVLAKRNCIVNPGMRS